VNGGPKVLIVTVNFRQAECTLRLLNSVCQLDGFARCHLMIVDNNSVDGSAECIRQATSSLSNVELLESPNNRGYFGGAKWALDQYLSRHGVPDWVIVCNNDIVFDSPDFLNTLLARDPRAQAILAPAVISELTGFDSNPMIVKRPSRLRTLRYRFLLSTYRVAWCTQWLAPLVRKGRHRLHKGGSSRRNTRTQIYAPHGSFVIFSRRFFEEGGFIDDGCFLYAEEFGVAETCLRLGLPIIHDPELRVSHNDNQTTGRMLSRGGYLLQKESLKYALGKYFQSGLGMSDRTSRPSS
jgi:GT2 family glycosyltransferase